MAETAKIGCKPLSEAVALGEFAVLYCIRFGRLAAACLIIGSLFNPAVSADNSFTLVVLPDTQNYVRASATAGLFTQQTEWIAAEIEQRGNPRNIQFVSHVGDIVNNGSDLEEWQRADASMSALDGVVKYAVLPGNHDYAQRSVKELGTENYLATFGPWRFAAETWYGGTDPSGNNSYQRFSAGGHEFIHLALEYKPTDNTPVRDPSPVQWAQSVIDAFPHTPVILSTHDYVQDLSPGRSHAGIALWEQLVRRNDQIFLVLNGHSHDNTGLYHSVGLNDAGREVIEVLQDFQAYENGGNGWLRLIEFNILGNRLEFETYSPVLDQFMTNGVEVDGAYAGQFGFDIDFTNRLEPLLLPKLPGDFDGNGTVNGNDFLAWQRGDSTVSFSPTDLAEWQSQYGAAQFLMVPEPGAIPAGLITLAVFLVMRIHRARHGEGIPSRGYRY
jgi:hypothetical protein